MKTKRIGVVVTTEHRGVFFGYADSIEIPTNNTIRLTDARMCIYWSADVRGVMGLSATGPTKSCRVTAAVPTFAVNAITSIAACTPGAVKAWEAQPWK